jgi:7-cyano-7-deazaguanine synthase
MRPVNIVAVVSGGMDSVTMAHRLATEGHRLTLLSFDYGQRHVRELDCARSCAECLNVGWHRIDLRSITALLAGSALTDLTVDIPNGHYTAESMRSTVVPNRNMMMLAIAGAVAVVEGAGAVAVAVHDGDHVIYPDCRSPFIAAMTLALRLGNDHQLDVVAPYLGHTKAGIVADGERLGVPWSNTWSCYRGGEVHCGTCGTCVERREAFLVAGVDDPTSYGVPA